MIVLLSALCEYNAMRLWPRMIALVDMNAFFASIEQRDNPVWRGRAVGVTNGQRGTCIITCSYEARSYGIKTGTRVKEARRLCSHFIQAPARPRRYAAISTAIMAALEAITPDIEIFSVDEAFLDLSRCQSLYGTDAWAIGRRVKRIVFEASGLLCSVGISGDKTTAKWAAKQNKPDGLTVVPPSEAEATLAPVPVTELCGISGGIGRFLAGYGVKRCGDMKRIPISVPAKRFGHPGRRLWLMAQGKDPAPVEQEMAAPKTIGHGKVIPPDTRSPDVLRTFYLHMAEKVGRRLRKNQLQAQTFSVGLRTELGWLSNKYRTKIPTDDGCEIYALCQQFLVSAWGNEGGFQVQITALDLFPAGGLQDLFEQPDTRQNGINTVMDQVNSRFGEWALFRAPLVSRSEMPNVIAPAWKPYGHRESIEY